MQTRIFYHARKPNEVVKCEHCGKETRLFKGLNHPIFTIGFEYNPEKRILFIAWAKPINGESYSKAFGIKTINNRLDRIIKNYPNHNANRTLFMPIIVKNNINFYIDKARKYFKEMPENTSYWF